MADLNINVSDAIDVDESVTMGGIPNISVSDTIYVIDPPYSASKPRIKRPRPSYVPPYLTARYNAFRDDLSWSGLNMRFVPFCDVNVLGMVRYVVFHDIDHFSHGYFVPFAEDYAEPTPGSWGRIRFMNNNLWDGGTLTASSERLNFPASNTQQRWVHDAWRSDGDGEQWLKLDLGSAQGIRAFILKGHWFLPSATVKIQGNATDSWSSPSVDVSLEITYPEYPLIKFWDTEQSYQWWRVSIDADDEDMDFRGTKDQVPYCSHNQKVGRIYLGDWWSPSLNYSIAHILGLQDAVRKVRTLEGQMSSYKVPIYRKVKYEFEFLTESDIDNFVSMFETVGQSVPLFICENPADWWETYYAMFITDFEIIRMGNDIYSIVVMMETMS